MAQRGGALRLAHEALAELLVLGQLRRQHLQRDRPPEARLARAVDDAHSAAADQALDLERAEAPAARERRLFARGGKGVLGCGHGVRAAPGEGESVSNDCHPDGAAAQERGHPNWSWT